MSAAPAQAVDIFNLDRFKAIGYAQDRIDDAVEHLQSCCAPLELAHMAAPGVPVWLRGRMLGPMRKWDNNHLEFLMEDAQSPGRFICCVDYGRKMNERSNVYNHIFKNEYFNQAYPELGVCGVLLRNDAPGHPICAWRSEGELLLDLSVISPMEEYEKGEFLHLYYPCGVLSTRVQRQ